MTDKFNPRAWYEPPAELPALTVMGADIGAEPSRQSWAIIRYNDDGSAEIVATGDGDPPLSLNP